MEIFILLNKHMKISYLFKLVESKPYLLCAIKSIRRQFSGYCVNAFRIAGKQILNKEQYDFDINGNPTQSFIRKC